MSRQSSRLLIDESPLTVLPSLVRLIGLNEAIVLQQIKYWLSINQQTKRNFRDGRYWTYNTQTAWLDQFPWMGLSTLKAVLKKLRQMNLVEARAFDANKRDQTLWYSINYSTIDRLVDANDQLAGIQPMHKSNSDQSEWSEFDSSISQILTTPEVNIQPMIPETNSETNSETSLLDPDGAGEKSNASLQAPEPDVSDRTPQRSDPLNTSPVQPSNTQEGNPSAALNFAEKEKPRDPFDRPDLPPWRTGRGANDWNEALLQAYVKQADAKYKNSAHTRADAIGFFAKRESPTHPEYPAALARAAELQAEMNQKTTTQTYIPLPIEPIPARHTRHD